MLLVAISLRKTYLVIRLSQKLNGMVFPTLTTVLLPTLVIRILQIKEQDLLINLARQKPILAHLHQSHPPVMAVKEEDPYPVYHHLLRRV